MRVLLSAAVLLLCDAGALANPSACADNICPAWAPGAMASFNESVLAATCNPTGNGWPTLASLSVQGTTGADDQVCAI